MKKARITGITGITGQNGSYLVEALLQKGYQLSSGWESTFKIWTESDDGPKGEFLKHIRHIATSS